MKSFIVFVLLVAAAVAAPYDKDEKNAQVLRNDNNNIGVDGFSYNYETSNGISAQEQGQLKNVGTENEAIYTSGQYSYTGPDGVVYSISYVADENGFQPQGAHIPQA